MCLNGTVCKACYHNFTIGYVSLLKYSLHYCDIITQYPCTVNLGTLRNMFFLINPVCVFCGLATNPMLVYVCMYSMDIHTELNSIISCSNYGLEC